MTTPAEAGVSDGAKIWAQLDAEAAGIAPQQEVEAALEAVAAPVVVEEAAPAEQADATPTPAPDAGQAMLDKIAGLESMLTQVTGRLRNAEGHIGNLNGQLKAQVAAAATAASQGAAAPSTEQIRAAQGSTKAMEALKENYPEFAEAMQAALLEERAETERRLAALSAAAPAQSAQGPTTADLAALEGRLQVESQHPGWQARVKTPEFGGWLQRQPREVILLSESQVPADAIRLLDIHKESTKPAAPDTTNQRRLDAAAAIPSGRSGATARAKPVEEMTKQELWTHLDNLDRQLQKR